MKSRLPIQFLFLGGEALTLAGSGAVMYLLISRVVGPHLLGQYSLVLAWILLFQALASFGLPEYLMREMGRFENEQNKYFLNGAVLGLITSVLAMGVMAFVIGWLGYEAEVDRALVLGTWALAPMMVSAICRSGYLAGKKSEYALLVAVFETLLILSVNVYLLLHGYGIVPLVLTFVLGKTLSCLLSFFLLRTFVISMKWDFSLSFCKQLLPIVFTFALSNVLGLISMRVNIIMLSWWTSLSAVGLYAAAGKLMEAVYLGFIIFAQLMLPRLARSFTDNRNHDLKPFAGEFKVLFAFAIPLSIGLIIFAEPVIDLLFGNGFQGSVLVFRILMVFLLIESLDGALGLIMKAAGRQSQDVKIYSLNPGLNIILNIFLIPIGQGAGAAGAKMSGGLLSCVLRFFYVSKHIVKFPWLSMIGKPLLVTLVLVVCGAPFTDTASTALLAAGYLVAGGLAFFWLADIPVLGWVRKMLKK